MDNQKSFLDDVAKQLGIVTPQEWSKVTFQVSLHSYVLTLKQLIDLGGSGVLSYYRNSIFRMLQKVYSDIQWDRNWFVHLPKFPVSK